MQFINSFSRLLILFMGFSLVLVWSTKWQMTQPLGAHFEVPPVAPKPFALTLIKDIDWNFLPTFTLPKAQKNLEQHPIAIKKPEPIWSIMRQQLRLNHQIGNKQVQTEIRRLLADKNNFYRILQASGPYIYYIYNQTISQGLPAELALIPVIESEFNPYDHSVVGATGLWQLMSRTAHELGVKIKSGYDGRRNVVASTKAALLYFRDLGQFFKGNWYLAIAAYDCGQFKVRSLIRRMGSQNVWSLPLPRETKYYVPRLLAVAEIVKNPQKYGIKLPDIANQPYFKFYSINHASSLSKLAKMLSIDLKTLNRLNPDYRNQTLQKGTKILIPIHKA